MQANGDTIFAKIISREIPADIVFEDESVLAFKDINPQAPTHLLVIPKKPLRDLSAASSDDQALLGNLLLAVSQIAKKLKLDQCGYRVVVNNGVGAGQVVLHLHLHILANRKFTWPPG